MKAWFFLSLEGTDCIKVLRVIVLKEYKMIKQKHNKCNLFILALFCLLYLSGCSPFYEESLYQENSSKPADTAVTWETGTDSIVIPVEEKAVVLGEESAVLHKVDHSGRYYYESLGENEQILYEDMYAIMEGMYSEVILSPQGVLSVDEEDLNKIFNCVMHDHPELFYVTGFISRHYTYGDETEKISFSGKYTMDHAERERQQLLIDAAVEECLSHISMEASDYEKVKYVYEYLILNTEYDQEAPDNQNICSVFIGRRSVCQGYAKATQYLLERLDIKSALVTGSTDNENHAWNLVRLDGDYYYVDTTWGDASYQIVDAADDMSEEFLPAINYDYLCVTTNQLLQTHIIENVVPLPSCTKMDANYYVMEGAYFTDFDEAQVAAFFEAGYEAGKKDITLKCSDAQVYTIFLEQLITEQKIFNYLNSTDGKVAYAEDADNHSLTFWLVNE